MEQIYQKLNNVYELLTAFKDNNGIMTEYVRILYNKIDGVVFNEINTYHTLRAVMPGMISFEPLLYNYYIKIKIKMSR